MSIRRRLRKGIAWSLLLFLAVVMGGAIAAYFYATDSETLSELVRREAPRFLPRCRVDVAGVRVKPFLGEILVSQLWVREADEPENPMVSPRQRVRPCAEPRDRGRASCRRRRMRCESVCLSSKRHCQG